jgi:hypothetical protein
MKTIDEFMFVLSLATLGLFCVWMAGSAVRADGKVEYCYIKAHTYEAVPKISYDLYGYRAWRDDNRFGIFDAYDDAIQAAEKAHCPLTKAP